VSVNDDALMKDLVSLDRAAAVARLAAPMLMAVSRRNIRLEGEGLKRASEALAGIAGA
jgi:hypothetical protein